MTETWAPVLGFEGFYEVSDAGSVQRVQANRGTSGGLLRSRPNPKGYLRVALHRDGRRSDRSVHRLVLEAFVGLGFASEANHRNGIKSDNRLANLEWVTPVENNRHARETGLSRPLKGERNGRSKLTAEQVREIKRTPGTNVALAARYGVSDQVISGIRRGIYWADLDSGRIERELRQ